MEQNISNLSEVKIFKDGDILYAADLNNLLNKCEEVLDAEKQGFIHFTRRGNVDQIQYTPTFSATEINETNGLTGAQLNVYYSEVPKENQYDNFTAIKVITSASKGFPPVGSLITIYGANI